MTLRIGRSAVTLALGALALAACGKATPKPPDGAAGRSGEAGAAAGRTGGKAGTSATAGSGGEAGEDAGVDADEIPEVDASMDVADEAAAGIVFTCAEEAPDAGTVAARPDDVRYLPTVTVSTIAGMATPGRTDGTAGQALFANPVSVIIEPSGALVICDFDNNALRRISMPDGALTVSTLPAPGNFARPYGMLLLGGTLYVDTDYNALGSKSNITGTIWKVDGTTGLATVLAPNLGRPRGLAALPDGKIVLGDYQNGRIRVLDPATGDVTDLAGNPGCHGFGDGQGTMAYFGVPYGVAVLADGRILVADASNHRIRAVTMAGAVTTYAGDGGEGTIDGPRLTARFVWPSGLAVDAAGDVFVTDQQAHRIRRITADGTVSTVAGDGTGAHRDGAGNQAQFYGIEGIAVTADGRTLYLADGSLGEDGTLFHYIRKVVIAP